MTINEDKIKLVTDELFKVALEIQNIVPIFNLADFYFAGGCIYSIWNGKEIKDYDVFCTNHKTMRRLKGFFKKRPDLVDCKTKNAFTVGKYQFVIKHIGAAQVEVSKFDFKHNCYYCDNSGLHEVFGWDYINRNELIFNAARARDVLNILTRVPKFVKRDMEISQKEIVDILEVGTRPTRIFSERRTIKNRKRGKSHY